MASRWLGAYIAVAALNVVGVFAHSSVLVNVTKPFLMPLLFAYFAASLDGLEHPLATWVKRALLFSWIGDLLLMGDSELFFVLGLLGFLGAQICYIAGFRPYLRLGPLRNRPWLILPYVAYGLILLALLIPDLGPLLLPVLIYAFALLAMAVLATGVSPITGIGGALFLLSDSLIALTALTDRLGPWAANWIMPTYVVGQLLIVLGVLQLLGRSTRRRAGVRVA